MPLVVARTPLRVSLFGGGSDLPSFLAHDSGEVLTAAIDKYTYVVLKSRFDDDVYANWMRKEIVTSTAELEHDLMRESLRAYGIEHGVEITTLSDIPAGTGLASSASITVGLLLAAATYVGSGVSPDVLARQAIHIEIDILRKPIGLQDQYICAYGGLRRVVFHTREKVEVCPPSASGAGVNELQERLLLFFTGTTREAARVLEALEMTDVARTDIRQMRDMVNRASSAITARDWSGLGALLNEAWERKRRLATGVSTEFLDSLYSRARAAGALGGKITGAGGGGFLLLLAGPEQRDGIRKELRDLREVSVGISEAGARVVYFDDRA